MLAEASTVFALGTPIDQRADELLTLFSCFLSALVLSLGSIPVIIRVAYEKQLNTQPCARSAHQHATPSLGGVAIFMAMLSSFLLWAGGYGPIQGLQYIFLALLILFFIGIKDDLLVISPKKKFMAQLLAALGVVVLAGIRIDNLQGFFGIWEMPEWLSIVFSVLFFVFVTNAYNLIDGIDGLAGGLGLITSLFLAVFFIQMHEMAYGVMALALAGALLGFLRFNFSAKKKIFMGDTGSMLVGFLLALFTVKFLHLEGFYQQFGFQNSPVMAICLLIVPIFDTLRVFLVRLLNGSSPFAPDQNHIHHYLLHKKMGHLQAASVLYAINILAILLGMGFLHNLDLTILFLLFTGLLLLSSMFNHQGVGDTQDAGQQTVLRP